MTFAEAVALLHEQEWIFAKSMPQNPHWYTLREGWRRDEDFVAVVEGIRARGYDHRWYDGKVYRQFNGGDGFMYWTMGAPVEETILINRKATREPRLPRPPPPDFDGAE